MDYYLSKSGNRLLFDDIVYYMKNNRKIEFISEIRGYDQFYYDFIYDKNEFCLHLENSLGIMIISPNKSNRLQLLANEIINDVVIMFIN